MGAVVGVVMSLSNLYVGLKTGWGLVVAITASLLMIRGEVLSFLTLAPLDHFPSHPWRYDGLQRHVLDSRLDRGLFGTHDPAS